MMRSICVVSFLLFATPADSMASRALAQDKTLQKEPEISDAEIESWVQDLGSANFDEREIATQKLMDLGARALPFLEKAVKSSKDSEVRWNAKRLLREIREAGRALAPRAPRPFQGGERGEDRSVPMEDLLRQMERQQAEMRRMMEEHFRAFRDSGDWGEWPFETDFDFGPGLEMGPHSGNRSFSLRQGNDGIRLEIVESHEGKEQRQVYEAKDMAEFREKYPEIAEKYGIGGSGAGGGMFRFHFGETPQGVPVPPSPRMWRLRQPGPLEPLPASRLGVEVDLVEPALASYLDIPEGIGLIVRSVAKSSLAEKMGILEKDVLLSINEKDIRGRETILATLRELEPGAEVRVEVQRAGSGKVLLKGTKEKAIERKLLEKEEAPK